MEDGVSLWMMLRGGDCLGEGRKDVEGVGSALTVSLQKDEMQGWQCLLLTTLHLMDAAQSTLVEDQQVRLPAKSLD